MYILHVILVISRIYLTKSSSVVAPSRLLVTRIGPCFRTNLPLAISEMSLTRKEFDYTISGKLNISIDVADGWSVKAIMQKCHDIRNLDTCDHYKSFTVIKNGCDGEEEEDNLLQDKFFRYVTPRLACPIKAGFYQISNYTFLTEDSDLTAAESKISTSVFGYTFRLDGYDEEYQKILCVDAYMQLIYVRNHDWIGNQKSKPDIIAKNNTAKDTADNKHDDDDAEVTNDDAKRNVATDETRHTNKNQEKDNEEHTAEDDQHDGDAEVKNKDSEDKKLDDDDKDVKHDDDTDNDKVVEHNEGADGTDQNKNDSEHVNEDNESKDINNDDDGNINKGDDADGEDVTVDEKVKDNDNAEEPDKK